MIIIALNVIVITDNIVNVEELNVFSENRFLFDQLTSESLLAKLNLMMMKFMMMIKLMMMMTMTIMMIMMMVLLDQLTSKSLLAKLN